MSNPKKRVLQLAEYLSARPFGATYEALADRFAVSRRTVLRDVDTLVELGFAVTLREGDDRRFRVELREIPEWLDDFSRRRGRRRPHGWRGDDGTEDQRWRWPWARRRPWAKPMDPS